MQNVEITTSLRVIQRIKMAKNVTITVHHKYYVKRLNKSDVPKNTTFLKGIAQQKSPNVEPISEPVKERPSPIVVDKCTPEESPSVTVKSSAQFEAVSLVPDNRKFAPINYEKDFSWLYFSVVSECNMCKFCEMFGTSCVSDKPFVKKGVKLGTHPARTLSIHKDSRYHKFAIKLKAVKSTQDSRSAVKQIFQCIDFIIKQKWAITENAEKLIRFVEDIGGKEQDIGGKELKAHLSSSSSVKYQSSGSITKMVKCMSDYLERKVLDDLRGQEFSLLADESSDVANRSQMINTHFIGFILLEKGTTECITKSIETFLQAKNIDMTNVRFTGFDGCNTMSVVQKVNHIEEVTHMSICSVHQLSKHRPALCLAHLIKRLPLLQNVDSRVLSLWKLFEFSPQKLAGHIHLSSTHQVVYEKDLLAITRAATTRLLSHLQSLAIFISRHPSKDLDFYGTAKTDTFIGHTTNMPALMNPVQLETELKSVSTTIYVK
ncbi:hypothetical protein MAR_034445, partial [Mya arenaria]